MKKLFAIVLALALFLAPGLVSLAAEGGNSDGKKAVSVSDDGLHIEVDFTKMEPTDAVVGLIEPADIGATDVDANYQIALYEGKNCLYTINGFDPAWIIYEINAPAGQVLDTLKLTICGRICDFSPIANAFAVFALEDGFEGEGQTCELNLIPADQRDPDKWEDYAYYVMQANHGTMPTSGQIEDMHEFDLTEAAKGASRMYVGIYQFTTNCPEWIEYRWLKLDATAVDKPEAATEAPTEAPAETEAPPAGTEEPAKATEEPAKATEEPAKATEEPAKATEKPAGKKGCGSSAAVSVVFASLAALAGAALLNKKKKR